MARRPRLHRPDAAVPPAGARAGRPIACRSSGAVGTRPASIRTSLRTLDDLWKAPFYTVDDIRQSIEDHPPWGDYQGVMPADASRQPMRVFMSGGTTGKSRPTFYTAWDREVGGLLLARQLYMQGVRPGDVVLNSWAYGLHNGAFAFDEAVYRWLNCVVLTTSTGNVTSSRRQVELAIASEATAIMTTGDYLLRLAEVAREMGYDPRTDFNLRAIPNIGDRALLESTFGLEYFATYGFHEVQTVAIECRGPRRAPHLRGRLRRPGGRPRDRRTAARRAARLAVHHRALQDRQPAVPLQHHGPVVALSPRAVRLRELAPAHQRFRRAGRQHGQAAGHQRLARGARRDRPPSRAPPTTTSCGPSGRTTGTSSSSRWSAIGTATEYRGRRRGHRGPLQRPARGRIVVEVVAPGSLDAVTGVNVAAKLQRFRDERTMGS